MLKTWTILFGLLGMPGLAISQENADKSALSHANALLKETILIDGHNDLMWTIREKSNEHNNLSAYDIRQRTSGDTDIPRLKQGHVGGQFWSVWIPPETGGDFAKVQMEQIDLARRLIDNYADTFSLALTADDIVTAHSNGKIAALIGMEGGYGIENSLALLRNYYRLGVRYMTLTHGMTLDWADAATDSHLHGGLTPFGKAVVKEMNRLGMVVDLAHVSEQTMNDALTASQAPVIFSHSSAKGITDHPRNISDNVLKKLKQNGGVVMVTFVPAFVSKEVADWDSAISEQIKGKYLTTDEIDMLYEQYKKRHPAPRATLSQVADHIEYIRDIAGVDHIGIGSDFWGGQPTTQGLEDVSKFPYLFAELIGRGWSDSDLKKLAGENVLRVMREAQKVATKLQRTTPPDTRLISDLDIHPTSN